VNKYCRSIFIFGSVHAFENKLETVKPAIFFGRRSSDGHVSKLRRTWWVGFGVSTYNIFISSMKYTEFEALRIS
jgi:hypothetical protein